MLTLTPTSAAPGASVGVSGSGFGRRKTVTLSWDGAVIKTVQSSWVGRFSATVIAPSTAGAHTLSASSPSAASTAAFTVTAPTPVPTPVPVPTPAPAPVPAPAPSGLNVMDYGAKGDGVTDDTAAINATKTAAGPGGSAYFPSGKTFKFTVLNPLAGQTWTGAGAHLLGPVEIYQANVTLAGDPAAPLEIGPVAQYGCYFNGIAGTKLLNLKVHDTGNISIYGEVGVTDSVIDGCTVERGARSGITIHAQASSARPGARNRITNNTVRESGQISVEIWSPGSTVQGNHTYGGDMGLSVGGAPGSDVGNNDIHAARYYGIELGNGTGSSVHDNTVDGTLGDAGIILDDTEHSSTVLRNTITNSAQRGIQLSFGCGGNTIDANTETTYGLSGVETHAADNNIIKNNTGSVVTI